MNIIVALLIFGLIIVIHELGHFLLAKKNGIYVTEFSVGMGPKIASFVKNETRYSLKLLPLGGSCMMLGEDEASEDERAFSKKSVWARIAVVAAGPIFNFILAFVLSIFVISIMGYQPPKIQKVSENYPAYEAGLMAGDVITKINGKSIVIYPEIRNYLQFNPGKTLEIEYKRDGKQYETTLTPVNEEGYYRMGIEGGKYQKDNILNILKYSAYEVKYWIQLTVETLGQLIGGKVSTDDIGGPVRIVSIIGDTYEQSKSVGLLKVIISLANISILLSANIGVMNLLPLPALDGGRLVFMIIEVLRGKPIDKEKEGMVHFIGFIALMILMVFIMFNDIRNMF